MNWWSHSPRDVWVVLVPLLLATCAPLLLALARHGFWGMSLATCAIALAVWWLSNTVAHVHLHTPVFRARAANRGLSLLLSLLTGVPQTIWRARHLAHHRGRPPGHIRLGAQGCLEVGLVAHLWLALALLAPGFLLGAYLPGLLLGLGLCQLQGRGEHLGAHDAGISHDGRLYNLVWLNDGFHAEHHRWPGAHWTTLPARRIADAARSPWAPVLRAVLPACPLAAALGALERLALACPPLQRALVRSHARAIARLMPALATCLPGHVGSDLSRAPLRIAVIGGGLFPRTALALARVWPAARISLVDADAAHLDRARALLVARGRHDLEYVHATWDPRAPDGHDLVIVPLALVGDRDAVYTATGPPRLVHDWLWRRRGPGVIVAWPLLKRLNLVAPQRPA